MWTIGLSSILHLSILPAISVHAQFPPSEHPARSRSDRLATEQMSPLSPSAKSTTCGFRPSQTNGFTTLPESSLGPVEIFSQNVTCQLAILFLSTTNLASLPYRSTCTTIPPTKRSAVCFRSTPGLPTQGQRLPVVRARVRIIYARMWKTGMGDSYDIISSVAVYRDVLHTPTSRHRWRRRRYPILKGAFLRSDAAHRCRSRQRSGASLW